MSATSGSFSDIVVAIHGIGDQKRFDTVRSVTVRLAESAALCRREPEQPVKAVAPQPLGYFHTEVKSLASVRLLDDEVSYGAAALGRIGFSEVFWADIPAGVVETKNTMEETKAWARTVVARAQAQCQRAAINNPGKIVPPDFHLAAEVLDEIIDAVEVLENLTFLADKAGVFTLDLRAVLEDYLGDVQVVTEFADHRAEIVGRFHEAMASIHRQFPDARLHVVAHSEGTVVSFLGLLQAMSRQAADGSPAAMPAWLSHVRGYMTIGSPIDKHLLLWPGLWRKLDPAKANELFGRQQIRWRNYYDYGDPVGFRLGTARRWLKWKRAHAFEFEARHDFGFARYPLPGKAHVDYWADGEVFDHFVNSVIVDPPVATKPPKSKPEVAVISPAVPYALSAAILFGATFLLYKTVAQFMRPEPGPLAQALLLQAGVKLPEFAASGFTLLRSVAGVFGLIAGATLLARIPRLAFGRRWQVWGLFAWVAGCASYLVVPASARMAIGAVFDRGVVRALAPTHPTLGPTLGVCLLALLVGLVGLWSVRRVRQRNDDRRQRWFWRGMRPLIFCGALGLALIVGYQMVFPPEVPREVPAALMPLYSPDVPAWPVGVAALAFLYLWWLAALIFDLAFVWQRYIRQSVMMARLESWEPYGLPEETPEREGASADNGGPSATTD